MDVKEKEALNIEEVMEAVQPITDIAQRQQAEIETVWSLVDVIVGVIDADNLDLMPIERLYGIKEATYAFTDLIRNACDRRQNEWNFYNKMLIEEQAIEQLEEQRIDQQIKEHYEQPQDNQ